MRVKLMLEADEAQLLANGAAIAGMNVAEFVLAAAREKARSILGQGFSPNTTTIAAMEAARRGEVDAFGFPEDLLNDLRRDSDN